MPVFPWKTPVFDWCHFQPAVFAPVSVSITKTDIGLSGDVSSNSWHWYCRRGAPVVDWGVPVVDWGVHVFD